ncbi:MAG: hypothetical protein U1G07_21750 [Verrucomicrobiota bacterium]
MHLIAWLTLLLLVSTAANGQAAAETNRFFPLMAWNWVPSDPASLRLMRDCGLTVAGFAAPKDLDLCQAAGLQAIVSDPRASNYDWQKVDPAVARSNIVALVAETGKHPAVFGYYLRDEPGAELFSGLGTVAGLIRELAPGKWPYINLFPNYASPRQLGSSNYAEHLERFIATCRPTVLSYDHYALMDDSSLRPGYWQNLEAMRAAGQKHRLGFWNIVLTVAHFNYREPTAADLRFQVYSTLAYGGRGIAYFTYFAPEVGNYRAAPIDQFGHPTPTWQAMRNVNLQVEKLAPTLLQLTSDDVYHFGSVPQGSHPSTETNLVKALNPGEFVVGDLTHASGDRYVMIVNKDVAKSRACLPQFHGAEHAQLVSPYTGQLIEFGGEQQWLAPGQGILLKLH